MLYLTGIVVSVYLLLLLLVKPQKTTADKILTTWQFLATLHLGYLYLFVTRTFKEVPGVLGWELPLPFIHGPFLYLYILYLTHQQKHKYRWIWHFLPFFVNYLLWIPLLAMSPRKKLSIYEQGIIQYKDIIIANNIAIILSGAAYVIASLVLLSRHRKNITGQFSNTDKITLNWLRYLIGGIGVIWFFVAFYRTGQSLYISVSVFIFLLGFFGIRQIGIFNNRPQPEAVPENKVTGIAIHGVSSPSASEPEKYEKSSLTETTAVEINQRLNERMLREQWYKNPELTLGDVAQKLEVHPSILSQVINSKEQKSFYDYINSLRVEEFKRIVADPKNQNYTLLSLAFECGFNSKSSFNRNFKKFTGHSPSDYLKSGGTNT